MTSSKPGNGVILFGGKVLPFMVEFPEDTLMFQLLNTDPSKKKPLPSDTADTPPEIPAKIADNTTGKEDDNATD